MVRKKGWSSTRRTRREEGAEASGAAPGPPGTSGGRLFGAKIPPGTGYGAPRVWKKTRVQPKWTSARPCPIKSMGRAKEGLPPPAGSRCGMPDRRPAEFMQVLKVGGSRFGTHCQVCQFVRSSQEFPG